MNQNNNQDLIELLQDSQKTARWMMIISGISSLLALAVNGLMAWKSFKGQKLSYKQRLMRNKAAKDRENWRNKSVNEKLDLEKEIILQEARHDAELKHMETGLDSVNDKDNNSDFLTSLKQKSESFVKEKMGQVKEKATQKTFASLNEASDKFTSLMDKDKSKKDKE